MESTSIVPVHDDPPTDRHPALGRLHLLTTVTAHRTPFFADWRCAWAACASLAEPTTWPRAGLICWVLMPDHWHGLVRLHEDCDLHVLLRHAKGCSARAVNLARGRGGAIWEPGFRDRVLRRDEDIEAAARYVVLSPVRAGLVRRAAEYPYWDACWLGRRLT